MKKPEVILENYEQVYDYYEHYNQPKFGAKLGHMAMASVFKPSVEYADNALEFIEDLINDPQIHCVVAVNHLSDNDQYVVSAMAHREPVFKPLIGNTFIQSKEPLFHHPNKIIRPLLRRGVDVMGAIPAFRKKDVDESKAELRRLSTSKLIEISANKLRSGKSMAIFPEGTRNNIDPEVVQPLRHGIVSVVSDVALTDEVCVIPVGFTYNNKRRPNMFVEEPVLISELGVDNILPWLHNSLQLAVDSALQQSKRSTAYNGTVSY